MYKLEKAKLFTLLFSFFIITLILFENDFNSKSIILILSVSLFYLKKLNLKETMQRHYPILLLFLMFVFSLLYSEDVNFGLKKIQRLLIIPVSILIFSTLNKKDINYKVVCLFYILTILFATLYSHTIVLIDFFNNNESSFRNFFNLKYSYAALGNTINLHTTYYSYYIITAVLFLLYFIRNKEVLLVFKVLAVFIVLYFSFFIIQLSSRIAIVTLYISIIFNVIEFMFNRKQFFKGIIVLLLFHLTSFIIIMNVGITKYRFKHLLGFTYYTGYTVNDSDHKIKLWTAAISANNNVLIGNGIGDIQSSLNKQYEIYNLKKPLKLSYNSHNQYIEYFVGFGIIGLILFIYLFYYYGSFFLKNKNLIGLQFLIITAIMSLTECLWNRHNGIVFILFTLFFLYNYTQEIDDVSLLE